MDCSTYHNIVGNLILIKNYTYDNVYLLLILDNKKCFNLNKLRFMKYKVDFMSKTILLKGITKKSRKLYDFYRTRKYNILYTIKCS